MNVNRWIFRINRTVNTTLNMMVFLNVLSASVTGLTIPLIMIWGPAYEPIGVQYSFGPVIVTQLQKIPIEANLMRNWRCRFYNLTEQSASCNREFLSFRKIHPLKAFLYLPKRKSFSELKSHKYFHLTVLN